MASGHTSTTPSAESGDDAGRRVAIIGAGASGLAAIKCCLDEDLVPVCYERTPEFGGLWKYTENPVEGQGCVMRSTVINVSKEMMSYSDCPAPEESPIFMHNSQVLDYFKMYSKRFDLEKHIVYNTEVLWVKKAEEFTRYGRWEITTRDRSTNAEKNATFDYVIVCTGHHAQKHVAAFPGLNDYKGKVLHSHEYRSPKGLADQRVLVVGIGNSGGDVAVELSRCSKQVFLSTRQGTWIFNRVSERGLPLDMLLTTRFLMYLKNNVSFYLANKLVKWRLNMRMDHKLYSLQPRYDPLHQHIMVNDDMPNRIICGAVKIKPDVTRFTANGVSFEDGTREDDIDLVILATGYSFGFPFIDKEVLDVRENQVNLYKNVFLPDLERQTMAIIGCVQPFGAVCPIAEIQCRAALRVFKREAFLPSQAAMWRDIRTHHAFNAQRYVASRRHTIQVEIIPYMDQLAELAGCSVHMGHLLRTDPLLAFKVLFGAFTPYQFRLYGPLPWRGAREAIMSQWKRVYAPLKTKPVPEIHDSFRTSALRVFFVLALVFLVRMLLN